MANLIETVDLQRAIRAAAYKKAAQLYSGKNIKRGWKPQPTTNQIRGVFRIGYSRLQHAHPKTKWMLFRYKTAWITKLDYYSARGGKPVMMELLNIIENIGGVPMNQPVLRITRRPAVIPPEPPMPDEPDFIPAPDTLKPLPWQPLPLGRPEQKSTVGEDTSFNEAFEQAAAIMKDGGDE